MSSGAQERSIALRARIGARGRRGRTSKERLTSWALAALVTDVAALAGAIALVDTIDPIASVPPNRAGWALLFSLVVVTLLAFRGLYSPRLRLQALDDLPILLVTTAAAGMALIAAHVLTGGDSHAEWAVRYWLFATSGIVLGRTTLHAAQVSARRHGEGTRQTLIVGAGRLGHRVARRLLERPQLGLEPIGFLDKEPLDVGDDGVGLPVLGASWDLDRIIREHGVEHVIVTFSTAPHHVLLALSRRCHELGVSVSLVPRLFEIEGKRVTVEYLGGVPLAGIDYADPKGWQFEVKHALDRALAAIALTAALPVLAVIALLVRVTIGSPVIHRQIRVGRDDRRFEMLKFRTMKGDSEQLGEADADWAIEQIAAHGAARTSVRLEGPNGDSEAGGSADFAVTAAGHRNDRRTRLGRLLRRSSLDELPQLMNVLRGEMSLVGPRPERATYVPSFEDAIYRYGDRHRVKSGITGWAQVNGLRGRTSLADRVEWDNFYVEHWSPWLDVKIVLMTIWCISSGRYSGLEE
jgi:exopolysaccharide biosynthesis polyprenyl glycosylphosphotransferase